MSEIILDLVSGLTNLNLKKSYFRKIKMINMINKAKKKSISKIEVDCYTPEILIDFCHMLSNAETLSIIDDIDDTKYHYQYDNDNNIASCIIQKNIQYDNNKELSITFKSCVDKNANYNVIDIIWEINDDSIKQVDYRSVSVNSKYSRTVIEIPKDPIKVRTDVDILLNASYEILNQIFTIFIENIYRCIKERFL